MLDIKFIRENSKLVEEKAKQKGYPVDIQKLLKVDEERKKLIVEVDELRSRRKEIAEKRKKREGFELKGQLKLREDKLEELQEDFYKLIRDVPNIPKDDVPIGNDELQNKIIKTFGKKPSFGFKPKDHLELGVAEDLIDIERAAKVSGSRFSYLKNEAAILEFALIKYALDVLTSEGFIPIIPPVLIKKGITDDLGYWERGSHEDYFWVNEPREREGFYLVGTAEHSIVPMHKDEIINVEALPIRYLAFSSSFRREAGSYGKDTRGIFRVHQFDKVEMVSFVKPQDDDKEHKYILSLQEKLFQSLKIPYQVVKMCTAELGFPVARKYDIEAWVPSEQKYREVTSASATTDFQSRRLNIKYKDGKNSDYVAILNATAFAIGRTIITILENYQQKDGSILIPEVLQKYAGFTKIPS